MTPMKTITLYHPHTHEGVAYTPPLDGIELKVNDADAAFLDALGLTTPPPLDAERAPATHDANDAIAPPAHNDRVVTDHEDHDA